MCAENHGHAVKHGWKEPCGTHRAYLKSICRRMPITRQSFFLPTQITGCSLWLDGADQTAEGMTLSGANVTSWKDKSGNGRHLSATSAYPTITSGGLLFNGAIPNVLSNATAFTAVNGINSFVVFNSTVAATRQRVFMYVYTGQKIGYVADTNFNTTYSGTIGGDGGVSYLANTTYIYGGNTYANSPFISHSENTVETQYSSTYSVNTSGQTQLLVGGQSTVYFTGTIKEVILYDAFITSAQRQKVEGYLAQKWSMTASLPAGHPGLTSLLYRVQQPFLAKIPYFVKFSPTQIPGCRLWLDAADASTVTTSGTTITAVSDKSTNATVLTSPAGFTYPNNTFNGSYPSFYNTSASGGRLGYNSSFSLGSQNTVFIVGQLTSPSAGNQFFDFIDGYTSSSRFFLFSSPNFLNNYVYGTNGSSSGQVSGAITTAQMTSPFCWSVALDTSTTTSSTLQYVNGTQLVQSPSTQGAAISSYTGIVIGQRFTQSSESVVGHICEFIIYNSVLTTTQRQQVESYLAQKWGLVSSLPTTNHIHNTFPAGSPAAIQPYVTSVKLGATFQGKPPSAVGAVSIASLTTTSAVFTWSSGTLATSYNFYIISPSGTSTLVASNIAYSAGATTVTFSSTLTYAAGNWTGGVQSVNQYGSSTTVLSGTTTMAVPFPYALNPITTASKTNFVFRDTRRQTQTPAYYWTHCIQLSGGSYAELRTDYSNANSYVSVNSSGGDIFSAGETDPYGNTLFYYFENGFSGNSYKHYVRAVSGLDTAGFIAGTKTASPSVSIQLGNGTYLTNNKTAALYSDNGYYL